MDVEFNCGCRASFARADQLISHAIAAHGIDEMRPAKTIYVQHALSGQRFEFLGYVDSPIRAAWLKAADNPPFRVRTCVLVEDYRAVCEHGSGANETCYTCGTED